MTIAKVHRGGQRKNRSVRKSVSRNLQRNPFLKKKKILAENAENNIRSSFKCVQNRRNIKEKYTSCSVKRTVRVKKAELHNSVFWLDLFSEEDMHSTGNCKVLVERAEFHLEQCQR